MMHQNHNRLLAYYDGILNSRQHQEVEDHVRACASCRQVLRTLQEIENKLHLWEDESPLPETLSLIEERLSEKKPAAAHKAITIPALPIFEIALGVSVLIGLIFLIRNRIEVLPFWETIQEFWLVQTIGSLGLALILIAAAGSLIALMLAPVLYMHSHPKMLTNRLAYKSHKI